MTLSNRTIVILLCCLPLLVTPAFLFLNHESDQSRFDRLQVGMPYDEVRDILDGHRCKWLQPAFKFTIREGAIIRYNDRMVLVIRSDRLVEKQWIGPDVAR